MSLISIEDVVINLDGTSKEDILKGLAKKAFELGKVDDANTFFEQLCLREEEATTGFGNGVAIPHARHKCVIDAGIIVARFKSEVDWNSMDKAPVTMGICLIASETKNDFHLRMLAKLARKLIYPEFVNVLKTSDAETLVKEINAVLE